MQGRDPRDPRMTPFPDARYGPAVAQGSGPFDRVAAAQPVTTPKSGLSIVSLIIAFSIPFVLGSYWVLYLPSSDAAILLLRPAIVGLSVLFGLVSFRAPATVAERRLALTLVIFCSALLIPSLTSTDPVRALLDWFKTALLAAICLVFCRALRHPRTAEIFGVSLLLGACLAAAVVGFTYVQHMGLVLPTYEATRIYKGLLEKANFPLNPVSFTSMFMYVAGMCLVRARWYLWVLGAGLLVVNGVFTGSRAPIAIVALSGVIVLFVRAARSVGLMTRVLAWIGLAVCVAGMVAFVFHVPFSRMSSITEGRWDLWSVACQKFMESPFLGFGFESWRDDLVSRLPGEYKLTFVIALNIAGGYHNEYLTMLAEQGLIGFVPTIAFFWLVWHSSLKLAIRHSNTWKGGYWALFACSFLFVRALVEIPGLFGYGQEPADYLAYIFVAIVISRFSREEDHLRAQPARVLASETKTAAQRGFFPGTVSAPSLSYSRFTRAAPDLGGPA